MHLYSRSWRKMKDQELERSNKIQAASKIPDQKARRKSSIQPEKRGMACRHGSNGMEEEQESYSNSLKVMKFSEETPKDERRPSKICLGLGLSFWSFCIRFSFYFRQVIFCCFLFELGPIEPGLF